MIDYYKDLADIVHKKFNVNRKRSFLRIIEMKYSWSLPMNTFQKQRDLG